MVKLPGGSFYRSSYMQLTNKKNYQLPWTFVLVYNINMKTRYIISGMNKLEDKGNQVLSDQSLTKECTWIENIFMGQ